VFKPQIDCLATLEDWRHQIGCFEGRFHMRSAISCVARQVKVLVGTSGNFIIIIIIIIIIVVVVIIITNAKITMMLSRKRYRGTLQ